MMWFRFYSSVLHDPKYQRMRPALFKFWVNLLCVANDQEERGTLPIDSDIAKIVAMKADVVARLMVELESLRVIAWRALDTSNDGLTHAFDASKDAQRRVKGVRYVCDWNVKQRPSDDVAARVRNYRKSTSVNGKGPDVTLQPSAVKRYSNVLDSDTELDTEKEHPVGCEFAPAHTHDTDRRINSEIATPRTNGHAVVSNGIAAGESRVNVHAEADPVIPFRTLSATAPVMPRESPRMPDTDRSAVEAGNLSSNGRNGHYEPSRPSSGPAMGAEEAIAAARAEWGDEIANLMDLMSQDIEQSLGGRWDCYLAAMRKVKKCKKRIDNLHPYVLAIALGYSAHGIPPDPVAHVPTIANGLDDVDPETKAKNKARREAYVEELMADIAAKKAKEQRKVCY